MDLSVIIVSWNVRDLLEGCLKSVFHSLRRTTARHEVIVVDNASSDGSQQMVRQRFPQVCLIANADNEGFAAGSNQGIAKATGRFLLLLNPDTIVADSAPQKLLSFMEHTPRAAMAGPRLVFSDGGFQHAAFRFPSLLQAFFDFFPIHHRLAESRLNGRYPRSLYASGQPFAVDHPLGACMIVRREAVERVGAMDEQFFMYCEEVDWALRLKQKGWDVYCVPAAIVTHYAGQSTQQSRDKMLVALWKSRLRLYSKHYGRLYNWSVRRIAKLGLWHAQATARREARIGLISSTQLEGRLAAYHDISDIIDDGDHGV